MVTPEEAIEIIWERHMDCEDYLLLFDSYPDGYDFGFDQAILIAAQAIEEVQQYRAIGTVEECKELVSIVNMAEKNELAKVIDEWLKYSKIGTVEECREAREKQKPKEIYHQKWNGIDGVPYDLCPTCENNLCTTGVFERNKMNYCEKCGQKLCWNEDMEDEQD